MPVSSMVPTMSAAPIAPRHRRHPLEAAAPVLQVDRVEHRLALAPGERPLHHLGVGGIDHQRQLDQPDQLLEKGLHVGDLVAVGILHTDVEYLRRGARLSATDLGRRAPTRRA